MTQATATLTPFDLDRLEAPPALAAGALGERRRAALEAFRARGLPGARDEAWRFTSLAPVARGSFAPAPRPDAGVFAAVERRAAEVLGAAWRGPRLLVVNGWAAAVDAGGDAAGVTFGGLADALARDPALADLLGDVAPEAGPFAALSAGAFSDGALLRVGAGVALTDPVLVVVATAPGAEPLLGLPRVAVALERGAQATVVEVHLALEPGATPAPRVVQSGLTQAHVGPGARLDLVVAQLPDDDGVRVHGHHARVERDGLIGLSVVQLGGRLVRDDLRVLLDGEGAEARVGGLYLVGDGQHVDDHVWMEHARPHGTSAQLFKGVVAGAGRAVFDGQVHVREDAQKTSAQQTNRNLLLSPAAAVNTNPRLTIHADDVKCSHGATIGQLDQDALFYLRARGLDRDVARALLTRAFAAEVVDAVPAGAAWVGDLVKARLTALTEVPA
ncbi:MAG: Fe-S cluster assembly protein SufD [Planctomycetes bacterium]|nr:Fe-S cluster assembly protein SufD [Planctomycetota bacterium]